MSNGSSNYNSLLKYYQEAITNFKNDIKDNFDNYLNYINKPHRGYLIKLEDYENLKTKLFSQNGKDIISNPRCLKEIEFRSTRYFINMLLNGNDYILINNDLWNIFGINNNYSEPIMYKISFHDIIFKLDNNIELKLWCRSTNNIIKKNSFTIYSSMNNNYNELNFNYQNIEKIYKQIFDYYKFQDELKNNLLLNIKNYNNGVFINKKWIDRWMEYTHYKKLDSLLRVTKDDKIVKNKIIYLEEINDKKVKNLEKIQIQNIISKSQLKNYLEDNSLVLVDKTFVNNFESSFHYFKYYTIEKTIEIDINNDILKVNKIALFQ